MKCPDHEFDKPWTGEEAPGCPECGRMINTEFCDDCRLEFMVWGGGYDDIIAGAAADSAGDFCCVACLPFKESAMEEAESEMIDYCREEY
jgi:hypothetical protein